MNVLPAKQLSVSPAEPFDFETDDASLLFEDLKKTMVANRGVGISAPQIGVKKRVFLLGHFQDPDNIVGVFNPEVLAADGDDAVMEEGCLSFPGLFVKVKRPSMIRVRYATQEGITDAIKFDGMSARIFLHEMDHLNGYVMTDRATLYHMGVARKNLKLLNRRRKREEAKAKQEIRNAG
jgi:peptide deformylase